MLARGLKRRFRVKRLHILMGVCALSLMLAGSIVELFGGPAAEPPRPEPPAMKGQTAPGSGSFYDPWEKRTETVTGAEGGHWRENLAARVYDVAENPCFQLGFWVGIVYFGGIGIIRFLFPRQSS